MFVEIAESEEALQRARSVSSALAPAPDPASVLPAEAAQNERLWTAILESAYEHVLRRAPTPEDVDVWLPSLRNGLSVKTFFQAVIDSDEATSLAMNADQQTDGPGERRRRYREILDLVYCRVLGRPIEPDTLEDRVSRLLSGIPFADMFVEIAESEEALQRARSVSSALTPAPDPASVLPAEAAQNERLWTAILESAYEHVLQRTPTPEDVDVWLPSLRNGLSVKTFFQAVIDSDEATNLAARPTVASAESDGTFLITAGQLLYGRGLTPQEVVGWQKVLNEIPKNREQFVRDMINAHITKITGKEIQPDRSHDGSMCSIMGTSRILTRSDWDARRNSVQTSARIEPVNGKTQIQQQPFEHSGRYKVSMIASLYKGARFIRRFLENITAQTTFDTAELIIIDADSPEGERSVIEEFTRRYPNIVYHRMNYRIGIYEAWNLGVRLARGGYLTNTNLDDLRRPDSIAVQATLLDAYPEVDVAYQDFYYSFEADLSFEEVRSVGFKTLLPILTANNLLMFNSPHNAPMWRANLHEEVGMFDTRYKSAGDYEFWLRCLLHGKKFRKSNSAHVAYYQNPEGISTRPDTPGLKEAHDILQRYSGKLISPALLQSRRDFRANLGQAGDSVALANKSYYDLAQSALLSLAERRPATTARLGTATATENLPAAHIK